MKDGLSESPFLLKRDSRNSLRLCNLNNNFDYRCFFKLGGASKHP